MASRQAEELIRKYGGDWAADRVQAEQIRQTAKEAGTWGVQQNSTLAFTPPKVSVPEENKTAADRMWDRNSQPVQIAETTRAKNKRDSSKKEYDDYVNSDEYKRRVTENDQRAKAEAAAQLFLNPGQPMPQPKVIQDEKEMQLRAAMEQAEKEYKAAEDREIINADMEAITGLSAEERRQLEQYAVNQIRDQNLPVEFQNMPFFKTAEQEAAGLIDKVGKQRADELAETYMRDQNAQFAEDVAAKGAENAGTGFWQGAGASAATIPINLVAGLVGSVGQLQGAARNTGRYNTLDPNATGTALQTYTGAVRGQVQQNIEGENPNFWRKAASIGYQGLMSAADSLAQAYLGGAVGGATLAATNSFSQTMAEASANGATPGEAALLATATAGIEALSEKIPLDNLLDTAKGGKQTLMQAIGNALKQAGIEATTEEISLLGTVLAEAAILKGNSSYQRSITAKILSGMAPEQAKMEALREILEEAKNTALVSMVSGAGSSAVSTVAANNQLFAQEQAMNNPALNKPGKKDAVESKAALYEKYGKPGEQKLEQEAPAAVVAENETAAKTEAAAYKMSPTEKQTKETVQPTQPKIAAETEQQEVAPEAAEAAKTETVTEGEPVETQTEEQTVTSAPVQSEQTANEAINEQTENGEQVELQRERPNGVREQAIPVTDPTGKVVSETAGNIYTSSRTPDSFAETIKRIVSEGKVSHDVQTNEESLQKAAKSIAEDGSIQNALNSIKEVAQSGRTGTLDVAKGILIYDELVNSTDSTHQALAEDCFVTLTQLATNTGRPMQLFGLFQKMNPEGQTRVLEREVQRNVEKLQKAGTVKKDYRSSVDTELLDMYKTAAQELQKAKSENAKREAQQKMQDIQNVIYVEEAAKLPTTFKAKWDAWRYMAMLGNAKTQLRNFFGNAAMMPYTAAKRTVGTILEKATIRDKSQRTKSVFQDKELLNWAKNDRIDVAVKTALETSNKLGDGGKNVLADNINTFGDSWLGKRANELQNAIGDAVSIGDMFYKNHEYAVSLAGFLKARGYTIKDINSGSISADVINEARNYAINEALKATFNDSNAFSDAIANMRYKNPDNPVKKAINIFGEGLMPFRKTPANVVMRFKDYSPAGLAQGLWNAAFNVRNGKVSAATAVDQIASGFTGTAALQLGYMLAGGLMGIKLTGSEVDEDEERQGHQKYALEFRINGEEFSYKIDWLSPANLPLFLGANIRAMQEAPDTESFLTATANAAKGALEPLLELSCMSSLNDLAESMRYAGENEAVYIPIVKAATSYLTQGIPAVSRQATQAATEYKQTTLPTSSDEIIKGAQEFAAGVGVGNPYKTDKVNAWGEKESTGTAGERIFNAFINPGTRKKIDNSALEQEISRLNKSQDANVAPSYIPKVISYTDKDGNEHNNHRMTEEEYQTLAQTQGQTARSILESMIKSTNYAAMTDDQRAKAMQQVYSYAREKAMQKAFPDHLGYSESWMQELREGKEAEYILRMVTNSELNRTMSNLTTAWDNKYSTGVTESYSRELETAYNSYAEMDKNQKALVRYFATGTAAKYIEAREKGISHADFLKTAKAIKSIKPEAGSKEPNQKQQLETIARAGLSESQKVTMAKLYASDAQDKNIDEVKALGGNYKLYTELYRDHSDYTKGTGKKNRTINHWIQKYGMDYSTAKKYYEVFS